MSAATRTAFVFAGGSSLGAIQVGMLKALLAEGWSADMVVGSSVGAINAAYFACDPTPPGVARLEAVWRSVRRTDIFPVTRLRGLFALLARRGYLVHASGLAALLEANLAVRRLEETRLPCHIIATDLLEGSEVVLSSGAAIDALLASAAIPGVFPPVRIGDRYLVDGGVANHTPISAAIELGANRLVILPTGYSCTLSEPPRHAIGVALHGLNLLISRHLVNAIRHYRQFVEIVIVPPLCPLGVSPYDFTNALKLIDRAQQATEDWLRHGGEQIDGVPHEMPLHSHRRRAVASILWRTRPGRSEDDMDHPFAACRRDLACARSLPDAVGVTGRRGPVRGLAGGRQVRHAAGVRRCVEPAAQR